jgi:hypothetical protein
VSRIGIVGSRLAVPDDARGEERNWYVARIAEVERQIDEFVASLPDGDVVVSGGAPYVDTFAERAALRRFGPEGVSIHRADWEQFGKRAGFLRNPIIVDDSDKIHAWWDGRSRGTAHTIGLARKAGKPVTIHPVAATPGTPTGTGEGT